MKTKLIGISSLASLIFTLFWLILMIIGTASFADASNFDQILNYVSQSDPVFYLTYINAGLVTLSIIFLFTGLFVFYREAAPALSFCGFVFIPIYGMMNLIVYLSQVTVVPGFVRLLSEPETEAMYRILLLQFVQIYPDSMIATLNGLAYAVLAIPSAIFGYSMIKFQPRTRIGGGLLAASGLASILGFIGTITRNGVLSQGTVVGGILFLVSLIFITICFFKRH